MTDAIKIRSHDELIAAIPHSLGFKPTNSMVCVRFGTAPTARLNLPESDDDLEPWLKTLTDVYLHAHQTARVALVAFGENGPRTIQALEGLADALSPGSDVGPVLWVRGDEWTELLSGTSGVVSPSARTRIDAEYTVRGRVMPVGSRPELAATMHGDTDAVAAHIPQAAERFRGLDESAVNAEAGWVGSATAQFLHDQRYPSDDDAARILVAISDPQIRDASALALRQMDAPLLSEQWQDLTRRAPTA